jgi:flagellin-like hook-associated protein FlgL
MALGAVSTFMFNDQSRADLARLQRQLVEMEAQVSSGHKASDLQGYGASAARILNVQGLMAQTQAHADAAQQLGARFDAIETSLQSASDATESLRQALLNAVANDDGSYVSDQLQRTFDAARSAFNQTFEGESLFAGERVDAAPIKVDTLADLAAAANTGAIYDEGTRSKTIDLGNGNFAVAEKASDVSTGLFDAMRTLKQMIDGAGGSLPKPLTAAQKTQLQGLIDNLGDARNTIVVAQGRNGDLQNSVEAQATRLSNQSDTLAKTVSDVADADLAEVAARITAVQVQYQAVAQTYSQLAHLSLLDYLT